MKKLLLVPVLVAALLGLLAAPALASPKTFYVHPSGGNDTKAIQATFNKAVAAGPGSVVQLSAGHFYVNAIWVKGFNGVFRGTGGLTVIDTPRAHDPSLAAVNDPSDPAAAHEPFAFLFGFSGGHLGISDMCVDVTATYLIGTRRAIAPMVLTLPAHRRNTRLPCGLPGPRRDGF